METDRTNRTPTAAASAPTRRAETSSNAAKGRATGGLAGRLMSLTSNASKSRQLEEMEKQQLRQDLLRQMHRKWKPGDVYSPHDLTGIESSRWKRKRMKPPVDVLKMLNIDPLREYKV